MNKSIRGFGLIVLLTFSSTTLFAQPPGNRPAKRMSFSDYLERVSQRNLGYAAEQLNINISEWNIHTAGMHPDPELALGGVDNGERKMQMGTEFGGSLGWTLELGGKRSARLDLARSESEMSKRLLLDYYHHLRVDAALYYLAALKNKMIYEAQRKVYENMREIAFADSVRHLSGEISRVTAQQTQLEAKTIYHEVIQAESEWVNSLSRLSFLMNEQSADTLFEPEGSFDKFDRDFVLKDLVAAAHLNRADLLAAKQSKQVAQQLIKLERANRKIDLGLNLGVNHATYAHNDIAPTPAHTPVSLGVSFPLKFSNRRNANLKVAEITYEQSHLVYARARQQVEFEVTQAFRNYESVQKQVKLFKDGMLEEAESILRGKTYSYNRGESSLLEVLDAQRTYHQVQQNYYETLFNYGAALVELEKAGGIWDIDF